MVFNKCVYIRYIEAHSDWSASETAKKEDKKNHTQSWNKSSRLDESGRYVILENYMITDFLLNPTIQGLRANNFGSSGQAVSVGKGQSVIEIAPSKETAKPADASISKIPQEAFALSLSKEALALSKASQEPQTKTQSEIDSVREKAKDGERSETTDEVELTEEEQAEVEKLKARDQEVRAHEQSHLASAGQYARGGIQFDMENGPDGRQYAAGGHVDIDVSKVANDPGATIAKMQQIQTAAMAPAEPSAKDRQVSAEASKSELEARAELREAVEENSSGVSVRKSEKGEAQGENTSGQQPKKNTSNYGAGTQSLQSSVAQKFSGYRQMSGSALNIVA